MEYRLTRQILMLIEADKSGHLTPELQEQISDVLDHLHEQHMAAGGSLGPIGPNAGLGPYINAAGALGKVKVPRTQFPKLLAAPKLPGVKMP
jgi:hypothetical protein